MTADERKWGGQMMTLANDMAMAYPQLFAFAWFMIGFLAAIAGIFFLNGLLHATKHPCTRMKDEGYRLKDEGRSAK
jgi:hypothetical protein